MNKIKSISVAVALASVAGATMAQHHAPTNGAFDAVIADEARLIKMLQKSGKISKNASINDAESALKNYLAERRTQSIANAATFDSANTSLFVMGDKVKEGKLQKRHRKSVNLGRGKRNRPANAVDVPYSGDVQTARVLAILMEFPDFVHNAVNPEDTGMYFEDYNTAHYERILFGNDGWDAPNGHHANSFKQYYEAQSGGSYSTSGGVAGWYMASQPAAFYGNNVDGDARALVREALTAASADPTVNLADYDIEDRYDLDGDGNYWEPDGLVDHIMIFHSSVGEEAGGGQLGEDAIWAHRWNLGGVFPTDTPTEVPYWGGVMGAYDYTIAPIDSAVGVISHEYGHDLGLPDEYDTQYTGRGEPVSSWSIMSSGSWAGLLGGTEPTGMSAWAKEFLQGSLGGNWQHGGVISYDQLASVDVVAHLDRASTKGINNDVIRVDLPPKEEVVTTPASGEFSYFGGADNNLNSMMYTAIDLSDASMAALKFKTWYDIEADWDYAYVMVQDEGGVLTRLANDITTGDDPNDSNLGNGITGSSGGWIDTEFDLSAFAGQQIIVVVNYVSDGAVINPGLYVDDVVVEVDGVVVLEDMDNDHFTLDGFSKSTGVNYTDHYYLLEWRTHHGIDTGLAHINVAGQTMRYEPGLLVWYVDNKYSDNWVGIHPGDGFLGVVDADQRTLFWSDGAAASTRYQIHDAAFSRDRGERMFLDLEEAYGVTLKDYRRAPKKSFKDRKSFISDDIPDAGRNITDYGLRFSVSNQSEDHSVGTVSISRSARSKR